MRGSWFFGIAVGLLVFTTALTLRLAWELMPKAEAQNSCQQVETFQGQGDLQTPPFEITGDTWQITYELSNLEEDVEGGLFVDVYTSDGEFVTSASQDVAGTNTTTVNAGAGSYYLDISSLFGDWTVTVEDCGTQDGGVPEPTTPEPTTPAPAPTPNPTPRDPGTDPLLDAGGSSGGPLPPMPDGTCPAEYPAMRAGACY